MRNMLIILPILLPLISALFINNAGNRSKKLRNILVAAVVWCNALMIGTAMLLGERLELHIIKANSLFDIYFRLDKLGMLFGILVSLLWICTAYYSFIYMTHEGKENRFYTFFIMTLGVTLGIAFSGNLITMYIFYEFLTLVTFPLVIHNGSPDAMKAGRKYLAYSLFGAALVLCGIMLLMAAGGGFEFVPHGTLGDIVANKGTLILYAYLLLFVGFGVKAAMVPLHSWLPSAMVAPTPVSALLHAVAVVKSGVFALVRITYYVVGVQAINLIDGVFYVNIFVLLTILLGSILAFHQDNLKKRLAYSTVSQLGYVVLGITLMNKSGLTGGLLHLVNHAVIKITLFFCVGAIAFVTGKKYIHEIKGIGKEMPITMLCFSIASISLIGLPPTNGFVSKWYLALGGLQENRVTFVIILLASALLTAAYIIPIIIVAFFPGNEHIKEEKHADPPNGILIPIVILTFVVVMLGLFPNIALNIIEDIVRTVI